VYVNLVMHMGSGAAPGAAELTDDGVGGDLLPAGNEDAVQMRVARDNSVTVIDFDHAAIALASPGEDHGAGAGAVDMALIGRRQVEARRDRRAGRNRCAAGTHRAAIAAAAPSRGA